MGNIHILSEDVISRIAAGEVIERPASVVKELLENSIDAKADRIEISVKQAGKTFIGVKDNGMGIEKDDLAIIAQRHSTSKIKRFDDLFRIFSMGFRGEALYSIASVSEMYLRSRTTGSETGWEIHIKNNVRSNVKPVAMQYGTEIEVYNLFYNVPARRKFLKSENFEMRKIVDTFIPYAICFPSIEFILSHNKKFVFQLSKKNRKERLCELFNFEEKFLYQISKRFIDNSLSIEMILGDINIQRAKKDIQFIFINQRPVQHSGISFVINSIYKSLFPPETFPFFVILIEVPPYDIDVNIHPTKSQVRIKNEQSIINVIKTMCEEILESTQPKQIYSIQQREHPDMKTSDSVPDKQQFFQDSIFVSQPSEQTMFEYDFQENLLHAKFIGTLFDVYLLFESAQRLYIIDQHAAHERITFENLVAQALDGKIKTEQLLVPVNIVLTSQEMMVWETGGENKLAEIGFQTMKWDNKTIAVYSKPAGIKDPLIAVKNILAESSITNFDIETLLKKACRGSTMAGQQLTEKEAYELKNLLVKCRQPLTCPHGRPTIVEIEKRFIEKQFLR